MQIFKDILKHSSAILLVLLFPCGLSGQVIQTDTIRTDTLASGILHYHLIQADTSQGYQNIHIVAVKSSEWEYRYHCELIFSDQIFIATSDKAEEFDAIAAINGGFFDVAKGGAVSYVEYHGEKVSNRSMHIDMTPDYQGNVNAAIVADKTGRISIEKAKHSEEYLESDNEAWVLVAGPLLYRNGQKIHLNSDSFVTTRHPRTLVAETADEWLFITVDGRHENHASGMNLIELQDFLEEHQTINAINLDGGGSTTMWINTNEYYGVINCPSDNHKFDHFGERKVANALLILKI